MQQRNQFIRHAMLPSAVFVAVFGLHFIWRGFFPDQNPAQAKWVLLPDESSWLITYIKSQSYLMGYTYALCLAFVAFSIRNYRNRQCCASRNAAIGSVTFTGILGAAGCFLIGCCGSPMLVVWMNLFGASYLNFAKPLIAIISTVTIGGMWVWMIYKRAKNEIAIRESNCSSV